MNPHRFFFETAHTLEQYRHAFEKTVYPVYLFIQSHKTHLTLHHYAHGDCLPATLRSLSDFAVQMLM